MWLLSTNRAELRFFPSPDSVPEPGFGILSHTWGEEEQTFQDVQRINAKCALSGENPRDFVSEKIRRSCQLAEADGYAWVWNDTCCIDRTSSAELSEAINSMFQYYSTAGHCYAYLADVPEERAWLVEEFSDGRRSAIFQRSRWHKRGWTLQELIAPQVVLFFCANWAFLGSKADMAVLLQNHTGIPAALLRSEAALSDYSIAQRMSWAADRETTRKEDEAYSLLGIFDINMPTLYGEGANAFYRLQEEIIRKYPDTTIFAWRLCLESAVVPHLLQRLNSVILPLLASCPSDFRTSGGVRYVPGNSATQWGEADATTCKVHTTLSLTPHGFLAQLPIAVVNGVTIADLSWSIHEETEPYRIYLVLAHPSSSDSQHGSPMSVLGSTSTDGLWRSVVQLPKDFDIAWETRQIYIRSRDTSRSAPGLQSERSSALRSPVYPCNRSYNAPFHFYLKNTHRDYTIRRVENADVTWRGETPAVLEVVWHLPSGEIAPVVRLLFGTCPAQALRKGSYEGEEEYFHWARQEGAPLPSAQADHDCEQDHITTPNSRKPLPLVHDKMKGLSGEIEFAVTIRPELVFSGNPWSQDTLVLRDIECQVITLQLLIPLGVPRAMGSSGTRMVLHTGNTFPVNDAGPSVSSGPLPVFIGSAILDYGRKIFPCKIVLRDSMAVVWVVDGGQVRQHQGYYYLLPFDEDIMEWIPTSNCTIPDSLRPIVGGIDVRNKREMQHAIGYVPSEDSWAPGHTLGRNWSACLISNSNTLRVALGYHVLCWREKHRERGMDPLFTWAGSMLENLREATADRDERG